MIVFGARKIPSFALQFARKAMILQRLFIIFIVIIYSIALPTKTLTDDTTTQVVATNTFNHLRPLLKTTTFVLSSIALLCIGYLIVRFYCPRRTDRNESVEYELLEGRSLIGEMLP
ncbi:hypothetical protein ACOME3_000627 [Neoechinorhynchus agilis]